MELQGLESWKPMHPIRLIFPNGLPFSRRWPSSKSQFLCMPLRYHASERLNGCLKQPLLAHIGTGNDLTVTEWIDSIEMVKKYPNIYIETSTSITSCGQIEMAVRELGPERVVFGSDSPMLDPSVQRAKITGADIPAEVQAKILGQNMARILKISATA